MEVISNLLDNIVSFYVVSPITNLNTQSYILPVLDMCRITLRI